MNGMASMAVSDNLVAVTRGLHIDCYNYTKHDILEVDSKELNDTILDIIIGTSRPYLAVITSASKQLIVYDLPSFKKNNSYILPRSASKIRFSINDDYIYVADKTGDVLMYDIIKKGDGIKLLGHLSLLLNVLQTNDRKFIISSDRDEKIRVSCYPNTYNIQTYCLGHREFVNHLELLPHNDNYLTSTSGDGTIKCWDYTSGRLCYSIDTFLDINDDSIKNDFSKLMIDEGIEVNNLPIVNYSITKADKSSSIAAVTVYGLNKILLYNLESDSMNNFQHSLLKKLDFEQHPIVLQFNKLSLFVYCSTKNMVTEYQLQCVQQNISLDFVTSFQMFVNNGEINCSISEDKNLSIKLLYKRKFDNVQEYQERKKQRLGKVET